MCLVVGSLLVTSSTNFMIKLYESDNFPDIQQNIFVDFCI